MFGKQLYAKLLFAVISLIILASLTSGSHICFPDPESGTVECIGHGGGSDGGSTLHCGGGVYICPLTARYDSSSNPVPTCPCTPGTNNYCYNLGEEPRSFFSSSCYADFIWANDLSTISSGEWTTINELIDRDQEYLTYRGSSSSSITGTMGDVCEQSVEILSHIDIRNVDDSTTGSFTSLTLDSCLENVPENINIECFDQDGFCNFIASDGNALVFVNQQQKNKLDLLQEELQNLVIILTRSQIRIESNNPSLTSGTARGIEATCENQALQVDFFEDHNAKNTYECTSLGRVELGRGSKINFDKDGYKLQVTSFVTDGSALTISFDENLKPPTGVIIKDTGNIEINGNPGEFDLIFNCGRYKWKNNALSPVFNPPLIPGQDCDLDPEKVVRIMYNGISAIAGPACYRPDEVEPRNCQNFAEDYIDYQETCPCETIAPPGGPGQGEEITEVTPENCAEAIGLPEEYDLTELEMESRCASHGGTYCAKPSLYETLCMRKVKGRPVPENTNPWVNEIIERVRTCDMGGIVGCGQDAVGSESCAELIGLPEEYDLTELEMEAHCASHGGTYCAKPSLYETVCLRKVKGRPIPENTDPWVNEIISRYNRCSQGDTVGCGESENCGDGVCNEIESPLSCPQDCEDDCGNGVCDSDEDYTTCPQDCEDDCGNGVCDSDEDYTTCPQDCKTECITGAQEQCFITPEDLTCTYSRICGADRRWGECQKADQSCPRSCIDGKTMSCPRQYGVCTGSEQTCTLTQWPGCDYSILTGYGETDVCGDGLDNDCDRAIDEGCICAPGSDRACGSIAGLCSAGNQVCMTSGVYNESCVGGVLPAPEICDTKDNDCDGSVDEGCSCASYGQWFNQTCGNNACGAGIRFCESTAAGLVWSECLGNKLPTIEICGDGLDNDCDGSPDEGCGCAESRACDGTDVGVCVRGVQKCTNGLFETCTSGIGPEDEKCNDDLDNDCDGSVDEGCPCQNGDQQSCSAKGVCNTTVSVCVNGVFPECDFSKLKDYEKFFELTCNDKKDNDCDGADDGKDSDCKGSSLIKCSDGTLNNECSTIKPKYCDGGSLILKCSSCGCPTGEVCSALGNCEKAVIPPVTPPTKEPIYKPPTVIPEPPVDDDQDKPNTLIWLALALVVTGSVLGYVVFIENKRLNVEKTYLVSQEKIQGSNPSFVLRKRKFERDNQKLKMDIMVMFILALSGIGLLILSLLGENLFGWYINVGLAVLVLLAGGVYIGLKFKRKTQSNEPAPTIVTPFTAMKKKLNQHNNIHQLNDFVQLSLQRGKTEKEISAACQKAGWTATEVDNALDKARIQKKILAGTNLQSYISKEITKGKKPVQIRKALLKAGWKKEIVDNAIAKRK